MYRWHCDSEIEILSGWGARQSKLMQRARERLVRLAKKHGIRLRQSYARVGKFALIKHQRYAHAKQFKRANRQLKRLRTILGAVIRDITRKLAGRPELVQVFALPLARRVRDQRQRERGRKVYSLHAPEVECIGKGKAHKPYEFGVKVSVATTLERSRGGQFVTHVKALPGNPYDGHTLETVVPAIEETIGVTLARIVANAGYRGHNAPKDKHFKVHVAGQRRGLTKPIKRALRRRGHRARHRPPQARPPHGPQLPGLLRRMLHPRRSPHIIFSLLLNWLRLLWAYFLAMLTTLTTPLLRPRSA